ncbi:phosphatase PAP2 family protein [Legionella sp. MW5194]|uniref:phosphatase PAP2 family protein n=1 Tax=Legionella sp. MW5194 TaxID=2662448 RepID=UPI00193CD2CE|nr:phosphatase PAP2 family protein [Legionella sp. MW5194]QRN03963.1 phosphatase PAP2 family protein [Legionella sp. MW5194]
MKANSPLTDDESCLFPLLALALFLSFSSLLVNHFFLHFHGNNYFPNGSFGMGVTLLLMMLGCRLLFSNEHVSYLIARKTVLFFIVMATLATMTNAAQYTPFPPIDHYLIAFEALFNIDMAGIVAWTAQYPSFKQLLVYAYASIDYQLSCLPLIIIFFRQFDVVNEHFFLLLCSFILGFSVYYFFPTVAPASMVSSPYFFSEQHATGIKFMEIQNHRIPSTLYGGMVAFPSFHAVWAWFSVYLCRRLRVLCLLLLPLNLLLIASCVLLGWHYPVDILGSVILAGLCHIAYYFCQRHLLKR